MQRFGKWLNRVLTLIVIALAGYHAWQFRSAPGDIAGETPGKAEDPEISSLNRRIAAARNAESSAKARLPDPARIERQRMLREVFERTNKLVQQDPEYKALEAKRNLRFMGVNPGASRAIASLGLPPDKEAMLRQLVADQLRKPQEARQAAIAAGAAPNSREAMMAGASVSQEINREMRDLLGPDGMKEYLSAVNLQNLADMVRNNVGSALDQAGFDLTDQEAMAMAKLQSAPQRAPQRGASTDPQTGLNLLQQRLLDEASQVLSPDEVAAIRDSYAQRGQMALFQEKLVAQLRASGQLGPKEGAAITLRNATTTWELMIGPRL
jgi:hypothetical protein